MEYRRLGKSGLQLSELSFGSWITFGNQIEDNTSENLMKNPDVSTVIPDASRPSQLEENLLVIQHLDKFTPEVIDRLETILENKPKQPAF